MDAFLAVNLCAPAGKAGDLAINTEHFRFEKCAADADDERFLGGVHWKI